MLDASLDPGVEVELEASVRVPEAVSDVVVTGAALVELTKTGMDEDCKVSACV